MTKLLIVAAIGVLLMVPSVFSYAQARALHCRVPVGAYSGYQNPDGSYSSEADFVRDLHGTPCGVNCTLDARARWARWVRENCIG
jgi:hypothetical protein